MLYEVSYWPESTFQHEIQHFRVQGEDKDDAVENAHEMIDEQIDYILGVYLVFMEDDDE